MSFYPNKTPLATNPTLSSMQSPMNSTANNFFAKRNSQRPDYTKFLHKSVSPASPPTDRGLHVFSAKLKVQENKQQLIAMELRLKKLHEDEEKAKRRISETKRKLQETQRIKESKR